MNFFCVINLLCAWSFSLCVFGSAAGGDGYGDSDTSNAADSYKDAGNASPDALAGIAPPKPLTGPAAALQSQALANEAILSAAQGQGSGLAQTGMSAAQGGGLGGLEGAAEGGMMGEARAAGLGGLAQAGMSAAQGGGLGGLEGAAEGGMMGEAVASGVNLGTAQQLVQFSQQAEATQAQASATQAQIESLQQAEVYKQEAAQYAAQAQSALAAEQGT